MYSFEDLEAIRITPTDVEYQWQDRCCQKGYTEIAAKG